MTDTSEWTPIRIEAPLPLGVAGTIMQLIGAAWPEAVIETNAHLRYGLCMKVPKAAPKDVSEEAIRELFAENDEDGDGTFQGFRQDEDGFAHLAFAPPEELCLQLGQVAHAIFLSYQDAVNHVEWEVLTGHESDDARYVLSIAKSQGQTPMAMHKAAQAEVERLTALLEKHGINPKS